MLVGQENTKMKVKLNIENIGLKAGIDFKRRTAL